MAHGPSARSVRVRFRQFKQHKALSEDDGTGMAGMMRHPGMRLLTLVMAGALGACTAAATRTPVRTAPVSARVAVPSADQDMLAQMLGGEFALARSDLDAATRHYLAAARTSRDPAVAAQAVRLALAAKQWDRAREAIDRWQQLAPDEPGLHQARATLALAAGDAGQVLTELGALMRLPDAHGWRLIGQVLLMAPDKTLAGDVLERLVMPEALAGAGDEIWLAMSQLAFKLERKPLAQHLAEAAAKKFASSEDHAWLAQLAAERGDAAASRRHYLDALRRDPKNARLRVAYATLLANQGDNLAAAKVLAEGPQSDYTYAARAAYAARADDKATLRALYEEIKARPEAERPSQLQLLGQLAEIVGQKEAALAWYQQIDANDAHWFEAQLRIAVLLDAAGRTEEALGLVHELEARSGDDPKQLGEAFLIEAEIGTRSQRPEIAFDAYARGLMVLPDDTRLLYARGLLSANLGRTGDAERDLRRVLELKPGDTEAMNALGYTLADAGQKLDEALGFIEKALAAKPGEPAIVDSYGWALYRLGRLAEAEQALRRAYAKQPDAEVAAHFGEVLWQAGKKDEARRVWAEGRAKDAQNKVLLETLQRLGA